MDANLTFRSIDLDESEEQVFSGPNRLMSFQAINNTESTTLYVHFYDALIADVTVGTTTPKLTYVIAAGGGCSISPPGGIRFNAGCAAACTTTIAGADAPAANACVLNAMYQP
jgi:hypothetical protein